MEVEGSFTNSRLQGSWFFIYSDRLNRRSLESKSAFMRIGIVNDTGLAREALRRVGAVIVSTRGGMDRERWCGGNCPAHVLTVLI